MGKYKIVFFGTPDFATPVLQALLDHEQVDVVGVVTAPDSNSQKGEARACPVKQLALAANIAVLQPATLRNNSEFFDELLALSPDLFVVAAYGKILPQSILDLPRHGAINVHPSLLPRYRGASPVVGTIISGDDVTGVTIIEMTADMDAGDIVQVSEPIAVLPTDTAPVLIQKLFEIGADMLSRIVIPYIQGEITPSPQDAARVTFVHLIEKKDALIDWNEDEELIERKIRAYLPWPVAHTQIGDMPVKIFSATVESVENEKGRVLMRDGELLIGRLKINELQIAGKNKISGKDFCLGYAKLNGTSVL